MSRSSSEDVLLIVNDVRCKKTNGALYMMSERMAWMPENKDSFSASHLYADIKMQKISPDSKDKVQLQVVMHDSGANTFHFSNPLGREAQKQDRDGVKELLQQLLPKFRRKISSELEQKNRLLQEDPELFQLYKDLVVSHIITAEEFWENRSKTVSNVNQEVSKQGVGVSAAFLADIKPETDGCNGVNYNLTADVIESIFRTYPMVKKKHATLVPYKMTESEFWTNFFQSHYFHRDRINVNNKDIFSECATKDEEELKNAISHSIKDSWLDLSYLKDSTQDEGFGRVSEDSRSSNNLANSSLIRRFNHHSTMVLKACEAQTSENGVSSTSANPENGSGNISKVPSNGLQQAAPGSSANTSTVNGGEPPEKKAKLRENLEDLVDVENEKSASLTLTKMERYLHGPTPVMAATYTAGQDVLEASQLASQEIGQWQPNLHHSVSGTSALCVLGELSPGGALMTSTSEHQLQQMVPEDIQTELRQLYSALCELLRHFWSCFPTSTKFLEDKVVKMRSTLERFENAKVNSFKEKISINHYNINLIGHMEAMLQAAFAKFEAWQARKQKKR